MRLRAFLWVFVALIFLGLSVPGMADGPVLPTPPSLLANGSLPASRFEPFPVAPLKRAKVIWLNLPALAERGFDVSKGQTPELESEVIRRFGWVSLDDMIDPKILGEERGTAFADYYGGGGLEDNIGSARAGSFGDVQVKGIGKTPMLKSDNKDHTARAGIYESMKDAIWGNFTHNELPYGGNRILALIDRGATSVNYVLEVREQPLRVAHFMRRKDSTDAADAARTREALDHLHRALPRPAHIPERSWRALPQRERLGQGLREYAARMGRQQGHMSVWAIYHGTNSQSNVEISGRLLDFVTATTQPGQAPVGLLDDVLPFGHERQQTRTALVERVVNEFSSQNPEVGNLIREAFPNGAVKELTEIYDDAFRDQARRQAFERLGIPSHLADSLLRKHAAAADALVSLSEVTGTRRANILRRRVDTIQKSRLTGVIQKIHGAADWSAKALREAGVRRDTQLIAALLQDASTMDKSVRPENFRKLAAYKASWHARPLRSLYFDELREAAAGIEYEYDRGVKNIVRENIESVSLLSQRKVNGLGPYEVPVSVRPLADGFQKELTTFDGRTGQWSKLIFVDPAYGSKDVKQRVDLRTPLRPGQELAWQTIDGQAVARVAVDGADETIELGIRAAAPLADLLLKNVSFLDQGETRCGTLFSALGPRGRRDSFHYANGVLITGGDLYPVAAVQKNLGLSRAHIKGLTGKRVLSVGEGYSGLLPALREKGVRAEGLDLWYGQKSFPPTKTGRAMAEYVKKNEDALISGSAFKMPVKTGEYDEVMSHMFLNNVSMEDGMAYFREAVRAVKRGGAVRTAGVEPNTLARYQKLLKEEFGDSVKIDSQLIESSWKTEGVELLQESYLLVLTKK